MEQMSGATGVTFYSVANSRYFLALVGLVNSLRANGHDERIVVVDVGLEAGERLLLEPVVELVDGPRDVHPTFLKGFGMERLPDVVKMFIDADVLCVRHLGPLIERTAQTPIVVFEDPVIHAGNTIRSGSPPAVYSTWENRLGLEALTPRPYVNAGAIILRGEIGRRLMRDATAAREHVADDETFVGRGFVEPRDPFFWADQDLLNALLATPGYFDAVTTMPSEYSLTPPYAGVAASQTGISCATMPPGPAGPYLLHHIAPRKPWLDRTTPSVYYELLVRALNLPTGAIRIDEQALPAHLRWSQRGAMVRRRRARFAAVESRVRGRLGVRRALDDLRRRRYFRRHGTAPRPTSHG